MNEELLQKLAVLLKQRRIWAGIIGGLAVLLSLLGQGQIEVPVLTDLLTAFGGALASLITAGLALWSYFKPKQ
jgi:hypothetical protein